MRQKQEEEAGEEEEVVCFVVFMRTYFDLPKKNDFFVTVVNL